ncbi:MAG: aspartyl-phosphate phosphatase Spo0E family protein [Oscillospiraceae bacterium]|nr:aspartyl-phosphate phosphatase Spo0E family protein [Oscillospiraceae bacterium]
MIDKKILKLREKLNSSIKNGASYDVIYKISVDLDEAIAEYYNCATNAKHFS